MLDVAVKSQLASTVRVTPTLVTEGHSLRRMSLADNDVSTQVATASSVVAGDVELYQQTIVSVPFQLEPLDELLVFWEL